MQQFKKGGMMGTVQSGLGHLCDLRPLSPTAPPAWAVSCTEKNLRRTRTQVPVGAQCRDGGGAGGDGWTKPSDIRKCSGLEFPSWRSG